MLFLLTACGYAYSQTVVKLYLPTNCSAGTSGVPNQKVAPASMLEIFPNPNSGNFTLNISLASAIGKASISIYNYSGNLVYTEPVFCISKELVKQIKLQDLSAGTYIVHFKNNTTDVSTKLIIK